LCYGFRLPEEYRLTKITGKTGRVTFTTLAMNNGVSAESTSIKTKHRDPHTMLGYVHPNEQLMMQAAIGIGSAMKENSSNRSIGGVNFLPSDSDFDSDSGNESALPIGSSSSCLQEVADEEPKRKKTRTTVVKKIVNEGAPSYKKGSRSSEKTVIFNINI
jgi:hypothetical protein